MSYVHEYETRLRNLLNKILGFMNDEDTEDLFKELVSFKDLDIDRLHKAVDIVSKLSDMKNGK